MSLLSEARKRMGDPQKRAHFDALVVRPRGIQRNISAGTPGPVSPKNDQEFDQVKNQLRPLFLDLNPETHSSEELRHVIYQRLVAESLNYTDEQLASLARDFAAEVAGYGPIQSLMQDDTITEIMVNGAKAVYYERHGQIYKSSIEFHDEDHLRSVIESILRRLGKDVSHFGAMIEARLEDGSRMNVIMPPVSLNGIALTIRRFGTRRLSMRDLLANNTLSQEAAEFLRHCVIGRMNIIISGGSGTGKSTLLNCLSEFIPETERLFTIEDVAELKLKQPHVVSLVTQAFPEP